MKIKNSNSFTKNDTSSFTNKNDSIEYDEVDELLFKIAKRDYEPIPETLHNNLLKTISELEANEANSIHTKTQKKSGFIKRFAKDFGFAFKEKIGTILSHPSNALAFSIIAVMLVTTTAVGARNISDKFLGKDTVRLDSIGIANEFIFTDEMENALVQNVPLNLIQLNDDYYIHIDSILVDEINFFTVFELHCKNGVTDDLRFTIKDLKISDENEKVIYNSDIEGYNSTNKGYNNIYNTTNSIKELFFILGNDNSQTKEINFSFSNIEIYRHIAKKDGSNSEHKNKLISFEDQTINIPITKNNYNTIQEYVWEKQNSESTYNIEKAILTKTGLYITMKTPISQIDPLIKINNKFYTMLYNLPLDRFNLTTHLILLAYNINTIPETINLYNNLDKNTYNLIQKN